jgi:signal transduction histidine kinase/ActR/RegA family two-component response regulator
MELRLERAADHNARWHLVRALPLKTGERQVLTWFGTCTDIEDQKRADEAVRERQKLDSIGLLADGIAHDFNNLLVGIMGGTSLALDSIGKNHPVYSMLETVVRASERAAHLTQQLLTYAGEAQAFLQPVDVAQLVRDTAELISASIPKTVHLSIETDPDLPLIETNLGQLQQLTMNLVINATEALGTRNGTVAVRTGMNTVDASTVPRNVLGYDLAPGEYLSIEVCDSGMGMDKETQSRIFDPFFTTKFTGRGLGLAAVQGIVRSFRGSISVVSTPGQGSTFTVLLPVIRLSGRAAPSTPESQSRNLTILLIDDEALVRTIAKVSLEREGHTLLLAENGPEGLATIRERGDSISLVLLDMSMPGMSGPEVLREIRKIAPDIPVAILSGYSGQEVALHFRGSKVCGFIQKPFKASSLVAAVNTILDKIPAQAPGNSTSLNQEIQP